MLLWWSWSYVHDAGGGWGAVNIGMKEKKRARAARFGVIISQIVKTFARCWYRQTKKTDNQLSSEIDKVGENDGEKLAGHIFIWGCKWHCWWNEKRWQNLRSGISTFFPSKLYLTAGETLVFLKTQAKFEHFWRILKTCKSHTYQKPSNNGVFSGCFRVFFPKNHLPHHLPNHLVI